MQYAYTLRRSSEDIYSYGADAAQIPVPTRRSPLVMPRMAYSVAPCRRRWLNGICSAEPRIPTLEMYGKINVERASEKASAVQRSGESSDRHCSRCAWAAMLGTENPR